MKRILIVILVGCTLWACNQNSEPAYTLTGKAPEVKDGMKVYLRHINLNGLQVVTDSTTVADEAFTLKGQVDYPEIHFLTIESVPGELVFMLENSSIAIEVDTKRPMQSVVSGSASNAGFIKFKDQMDALRDESKEILMAYREARVARDSTKYDSISNLLQQNGKEILALPLDFIRQNNDLEFSLNLIALETNKPGIEVEAYMAAFEGLTPELKNAARGIEIKQKLENIREAQNDSIPE